ncbi:MAG TPA: CHASE2 domain-containing protein, partial [Candidatus Marinimicrobia bacterium]|nr:CHASE2 domain-containing protein [Candidatus Neomarinimicrobiota bacterium]
MPDILKRVIIGAGIGLVTGLLIGWGTNIEGFFLDSLLDGYEYRSYDARIQAKAFAFTGVYDVTVYHVDSTVVPPETTDVTDHYGEDNFSGYFYADSIYLPDIIIVDINQLSVEVLGNYLNWPHATHGELIDAISSGGAKAILFDIIFHPENSSDFQMVNQLLQENQPSDEYLLEEAERYLASHDTLRFIRSTTENSNVYHSLVFEQGQGGIEVGSAFAGDSSHLILGISPEKALRLPGSDRLGNTHLELLAGAKGLGAANLPQDKDG